MTPERLAELKALADKERAITVGIPISDLRELLAAAERAEHEHVMSEDYIHRGRVLHDAERERDEARETASRRQRTNLELVELTKQLENERDEARAQVAALRECLSWHGHPDLPAEVKRAGNRMLEDTAAAARAHDEALWKRATEAQREADVKLAGTATLGRNERIVADSVPEAMQKLGFMFRDAIALLIGTSETVPPPAAAEPQP